MQERQVVESKENELEEWKRRERARVEEKVERARRPLVEQLEQLQKEKSQAEETLQEQQGKLCTCSGIYVCLMGGGRWVEHLLP